MCFKHLPVASALHFFFEFHFFCLRKLLALQTYDHPLLALSNAFFSVFAKFLHSKYITVATTQTLITSFQKEIQRRVSLPIIWKLSPSPLYHAQHGFDFVSKRRSHAHILIHPLAEQYVFALLKLPYSAHFCHYCSIYDESLVGGESGANLHLIYSIFLYAFLQSNMYLRQLKLSIFVFGSAVVLTDCKPKFQAITLGPRPVSTSHRQSVRSSLGIRAYTDADIAKLILILMLMVIALELI